MELSSLAVEEFNELVKFIPQVQDNITRFELRDTGISSPFTVSQADLICPDLDSIFFPLPPSQEPVPIIRHEELLNSQPKFPSPPSDLPDLPPPLIDPSLENDLGDLMFLCLCTRKKEKTF